MSEILIELNIRFAMKFVVFSFLGETSIFYLKNYDGGDSLNKIDFLTFKGIDVKGIIVSSIAEDFYKVSKRILKIEEEGEGFVNIIISKSIPYMIIA